LPYAQNGDVNTQKFQHGLTDDLMARRGQQAVNFRDEVFKLKWFADKVVCTDVAGAGMIQRLTLRAHQNNRDMLQSGLVF
jgi:hypothetical protein